ncbi:hypothetical protein U1Q18_039065 [Sarracenia purpurea var. burkii]
MPRAPVVSEERRVPRAPCNLALGEVLPSALLSVNHHHHAGDLHPRGPEQSGGLKDEIVAGDEVLDDEADLAVPEGALDGLGVAESETP